MPVVELVALSVAAALQLYGTIDAIRLRVGRMLAITVLVIASAVIAGRRMGGYFDVWIYLPWVVFQSLLYFAQLRPRARRERQERSIREQALRPEQFPRTDGPPPGSWPRA